MQIFAFVITILLIEEVLNNAFEKDTMSMYYYQSP